MANDPKAMAATAPSFMFQNPAADAIVLGTWGDDSMAGSAADEVLYGGKGSDFIDGGGGIDTVLFEAGYAVHQVSFDTDSGSWVVERNGERETLANVEFIQFADVRIDLRDPALHQATVHQVGASGGRLIGNDLGYSLTGNRGDDTLVGNGGDDQLYGGKGSDTAVYRGARSDYVIAFDMQTQSYTVVDKHGGRDGADRLVSIEWLEFADGTVAIDSVATAIPAPPASQDRGVGVPIDNGGSGGSGGTDWPAVNLIGLPGLLFPGSLLPDGDVGLVADATVWIVPLDLPIAGQRGDDQLYGGKASEPLSYRAFLDQQALPLDPLAVPGAVGLIGLEPASLGGIFTP